MRLSNNELYEYIFSYKNDLSTDTLKVPRLLKLLWVIYSNEFKKLYSLETEIEKEKFIYWALINIKNIDLFYNKEIFDKLVEYNNLIDLNQNDIFIQPTSLLKLIWNNRLDIQQLFPNIESSDNSNFWKWWFEDGYTEYKLMSPIYFSELKNEDFSKLFLFIDKLQLLKIPLQALFKFFIKNFHFPKEFTINEITPFMILVWKSRIDLQEAFPNINQINKNDFINWWFNYGEEYYRNVYDKELTKTEKYSQQEKLTVNYKDVAIIGHAEGMLGLGEDARLISKSLDYIEIKNTLFSSNPYITCSKVQVNNIKSLSDYNKGFHLNIFTLPANDIIDILLRYGIDVFFGAKVNICITQWELSTYPKDYNIIKYLMDRVCSISEYSADSLGNTLNTRVSIVPLPFEITESIDLKKEKKVFTFYFAFDGNSFIARKNPLGVIDSFQMAFKDENVRLIIKVMNSSSNDLWNECLRRAYNDTRIEIIDSSLSRNKYIELLDSIDCVVSLHRAEGFGRIIAEAMLMEKPVIVSNYSGNLDYTTSLNAYLVNGSLVPLFEGDYYFYEENNWFEPSIVDACEKMRYVYFNQKNAKAVAKNGKKTILDNYSFKKCSNKIFSIWNEIIIEKSALFDKEYYKSNYGIEDKHVEHYIKEGSKLGYNPSKEFNTDFYLKTYVDVLKSNMNPLFHYILYGIFENRFKNEKELVSGTTKIVEIDYKNILDTKDGMIFISHEATKTGAPIVLLELCKEYAKNNNNFIVILMSGGVLEKEFAKLAPVINLGLSLFAKEDISISPKIISLFGELIKKGYSNCIANTVLTGYLTPFLEINCIKTTYLIHEMPELIKEYNFTEAAMNIGQTNANIVFPSNLVADQFTKIYIKNQKEHFIIPQGIPEKTICTDKINARKNILAKIKCENLNSKIILGAGLTQHRKGTDLFLEVIRKCADTDKINEYQFIWLGDKDKEYSKWEREELPKLSYKAHIHFVDFVEDPSDYFGAADIFLLTSREDPLPGVALIALKNNIPLIMFENTGGIQEYISNKNGSIIPQFDTSKMTSEIIRIIESGMKVESNVSVNSTFEYFQKVISTFERKSTTKVSVVIPNYNYEKYMPERLNSIINQTHKVDEIIFLDDCSKDNSVNVARGILEKSNIDFQIIENKQNAGVYRQWLKGFDLAKNDLVWIAEADDFAEPNFLETLISLFNTNKQIGLAYSQSTIIDENGKIIHDNVKFHTDEIDKDKWKNSYINNGLIEIEKVLLYRNTIPNVSACLINKKYLLGIDSEILKYKYCGDWFLYSYLLNKSNIAFCNRSLNHFRKHTNNVTTTNTFKDDYIEEVLEIKNYIYSIQKINSRMHEKMLTLFEKDFISTNPNKNKIKEKIQDKIKTLEKNLIEDFVFVTFNREFGGSEVMWFDLANYLVNKNIKLTILCPKGLLDNKKLSKLIENKVEIIEIDNFELTNLIELDVSYVLFSIGDHNDGGEYFEYCFKNNIKYAIINQLVKEDMWTTDKNQLKQIFDGYKNANGTFFTCENNIDIFNRKAKIKLENAQVHFNPISIDRDDYVDYPEIKDRYCLAFPGRLLTIHKGQDVLLKVLSSEKWLNRNILVNFYGVGPDEEKLMKMAKKYNLNNVKFCGYVTDVRKIWESNHAFILTSHMEGIPIVLLGAMFAGRMSVVTNVGGNKEIIDDNKTGFIADKPNIESVDEALERAWGIRDKWKELGKEAREDILKHYPLNPLLDFQEKLERVFKW